MKKALKDQVKITGKVKIVLKSKSGKTKKVIESKNLVVNSGLNLAAKRIAGVAANAIGYIAAGSGTTAPAVGQTALQGTEHSRVALSNSVSGAVITATATIGPFAATKSIGELGIFDDVAAGVMFSRVTPVQFNMDPSDTIAVTWELTLS